MKKLLHLSLLFVAVLYSCSSQKTNTKTVTGVVIGIGNDESKELLSGATIQVKQKTEKHTQKSNNS